MTNPLFIEIEKFDQWAQSQYNIPQDDIGGEWECNYEQWNNIYTVFEDFLHETEPSHWSHKEKERLLYIIARDNEIGRLAATLPEQALIEYQRIAVLYALKEINSKQLDKYIRLAKQDGRRYLVENAIKIEGE